MKAIESEIADHPFLSSMSERHRAVLLECAEERNFKPGDIIYREGEPANRFYLIESGHVCLETVLPDHRAVPVQRLGPGDVLGWSWLFEPFVCCFQARALETVRTVSFDAAHLLRVSNEDESFGYDLMKRVSRVVQHALRGTRDRLVEALIPPKAS